MKFVAVDLGATSGRVMLADVGPNSFEMRALHRFSNDPVYLWNGERAAMHWDLPGLFAGVCTGLAEAGREAPDLTSIGVDSWAVDYGLLRGGKLLGLPYNYRDARCARGVDAVHATVSQDRLFARNGLQFLPFNTLYQFAADRHVHDPGVQALLIPDLLGYWLTGKRVAEDTNASTTGLLDANTGQWSTELMNTFGLPTTLLPRVVPPGSIVGDLTDDVRALLGLHRPLTVSTVGSHDTASAIVGIPAENPHFAYISCGTWGLVGVELDQPVLTEESRAANFTNERGVDGTIRYLRNVMGLWLLSETLRTWELQGHPTGLTELIAMAADVPAGGPTFDPDAPQFLPPGDMPQRINDACVATGQRPPVTRPEIIRCILDSLAVTFAARVHEAGRLSGQRIDVIHIVGGGSQNQLLCQLVADAAGLPVVAGPVEATALGNLLVQARTHGALSGDLWDLRAQLRAAVTTAIFNPRPV